MICTFFGHSDCYELDSNKLRQAIETLIADGVDTFYVGYQGNFDNIVLAFLSDLKVTYPGISYSVVLAYMPTIKQKYAVYYDCSIYPEGLESIHPKYAIEKRNKWMIERADYCICYVNHTCGGAYKFARKAKQAGLKIINLGSAEL